MAEINRRGFLGGIAAAILVPTWRPNLKRMPINLAAFCGDDLRYDMREPFAQDYGGRQWAYATDSRLCVRVADATAKPAGTNNRRPPANALPWWEPRDVPWQPWPDRKVIVAHGVSCPECKGYSYRCIKCGGGPSEYGTCHLCLKCGSTDFRRCPNCDYRGYVVGPSYQRIGGAYFDQSLDALIRREIGRPEFQPPAKEGNPILFRAAGVTGVLMPYNRAIAEEFIREGNVDGG